MTKAIISDGGDILFTSQDKEILYKFTSNYKPISFGEFRAGFETYRARANKDQKYNLDNAFCDYLISIGLDKEAIKVYMNSSERNSVLKHKGRIVREGVRETLEELQRKGINFIVATDASLLGYELISQLNPLGLSGLVHDIVSSKDVGEEKPSEKFFNQLLRANDLKKPEVLFVGHDEDELRGAHEQGLEVIALNYDPSSNLAFMRENHKISSFSEILRFIRS